MEPTIIPTVVGSWPKRTARAVPQSSSDEEIRPQKRLKKHRGSTPESSSGVEEGPYDRKYTSDLLSIRDLLEVLQSDERNFHRSQQEQYEALKRMIGDMESRWTREQHKRQMTNAKQRRRRLEGKILQQNGQASGDLMASGMVVGEALTPAVTPANQTVVSCLPTPRETVRRSGRPPAPLDQKLEGGLKTDLFRPDPAIQRFKSEKDSDILMFAARTKGKQPARPSLMGLKLQNPRVSDNKRLRAALIAPIDINTSDGDDEDDIADDTASLQAEQMASASDFGGIIWPAGVGIGPELDGIDVKDEHPSVADIPFPELDQAISPSTVCAGPIVPVCPGPFRTTPSGQLGSPILGHDRSVWRAADHRARGNPGPSVGGTSRGIGRNGKMTAAATTPATTAAVTTTIASSSISRPIPAGRVTKVKKSLGWCLKTPDVPRPPVASDTSKKQERDPERLINNGKLIPMSDGSGDDMDMDMDMDMDLDMGTGAGTTQPRVQLPPMSGGLSTRGYIQTLGIPPPAPNIPVPMLRFSRAHIQKAFGGKPRGTVTIVKANANRIFPVEQFLCISEKLNPYYPPHAGANGAMFIFRTGAVPLNTEWAVFCSRPRIGAGPQETFEYAGNYIVRDVNDVPYEEWVSFSTKFKEGWASHVAHQAKSPKGWASQNLASRKLVRSADGITPEQVRAWFEAAAPARLRHPHARLGRRVLEFKEYKNGIYNTLVKMKQ